jgi:mercuric ion transport protein
MWGLRRTPDADGRMPLFPSVRTLRSAGASEAGRLLCILLLRLQEVPTDAVRRALLLRTRHAVRRDCSPTEKMNRTKKAVSGYAGGAGAIAATCAALCCAGAPIIVSVLSATGLSFLRDDAILLPVIGVALVIAQYGFWNGRALHGSSGPFVLGLVGGMVLVLGVVYLHGFIAKVCIGVGAIALLVATVWNARRGSRCDVPVVLARRASM